MQKVKTLTERVNDVLEELGDAGSLGELLDEVIGLLLGWNLAGHCKPTPRVGERTKNKEFVVSMRSGVAFEQQSLQQGSGREGGRPKESWMEVDQA